MGWDAGWKKGESEEKMEEEEIDNRKDNDTEALEREEQVEEGVNRKEEKR